MASHQRWPPHWRHHHTPSKGWTRKRSRPPQNGHGPAHSPPAVVATLRSRVSRPSSASRSMRCLRAAVSTGTWPVCAGTGQVEVKWTSNAEVKWRSNENWVELRDENNEVGQVEV